MLKNNVASRVRTSDEKSISYHLTDFTGDVLYVAVVETSRRDAFRNDHTEVSTESNPDGTKCVQVTIENVHRCLNGMSIMCPIEGDYFLVRRTSLFENTHTIKQINQSTQEKSVKWIDTISSIKSNVCHTFNA